MGGKGSGGGGGKGKGAKRGNGWNTRDLEVSGEGRDWQVVSLPGDITDVISLEVLDDDDPIVAAAMAPPGKKRKKDGSAVGVEGIEATVARIQADAAEPEKKTAMKKKDKANARRSAHPSSLIPTDMFKSQTDKFSQFDEDGVPTHDAAGTQLGKNAMKRLRKEWEWQKKTLEKKEKKDKKYKEKREEKAEAKAAAKGAAALVVEDGAVARVAEMDADTLRAELPAWSNLGLHVDLLRSIALLGFVTPTPIQEQALPHAVANWQDIIGAAETGSGKTLAFGLPILHKMLNMIEGEGEGEGVEAGLRALVMAPTRELALQVKDHMVAVARFTKLRIVAIVGGLAAVKQQRLLANKPHVVVGTPGRVWDIISNSKMHHAYSWMSNLRRSLSFLVIDEADRMVEDGYFKELDNILDTIYKKKSVTTDSEFNRSAFGKKKKKKKKKKKSNVRNESVDGGDAEVEDADEDEDGDKSDPEEEEDNDVDGDGDRDGDGDGNVEDRRNKRQTFVFSATLAFEDASDARDAGFGETHSKIDGMMQKIEFRNKVKRLDLSSKRLVNSRIDELKIRCLKDEKDTMLAYLLMTSTGRTLLFFNTISNLRRVNALLAMLQLPVTTLHASMQQKQRLQSLDKFKSNPNAVLLATDVAARGLDIKDVATVVHYDIPKSSEGYVHRCGRTARGYDTVGRSVALVGPSDTSTYNKLMYSLNRPEGIPDIQVEVAYQRQIQKRVNLARRLEQLRAR